METKNVIIGLEKREKKTVFLLWSGGWDGTFRLLQLAQYDIDIQPIYVIDSDRKSNAYEQNAMKKIMVECKKRFAANILDIVYYEKQWIIDNCKDTEISESFARLRAKYHVGAQYEWFALLCKKMNIVAESAVVHQYHGKVEDAIEAESKLEIVEDDFLPERYRVLPGDGENDPYLVFGNLIFPVIKLTKQDEERISRENNWIDILQNSWFCHSPINGEPCGLCGPCDDAMNTGMEWRMPESAKKRYRHKKLYTLVRKVRRKLGGK